MGSVHDETVDAGGSSPARRELAPAAMLGKYRLEKLLGAGGAGMVWAARDPDLERTVALKVLRHDNPAPESRLRLLREARAMARLKHPNVLTVYEVDTDGDRDFIAMELVDGSSLDAWLETRPPRDAVWDALLAAGRGLAEAHRAGIVHRDFKPHNVLRSSTGRVLVTDFGLAREHGDPAASEPVPDEALATTALTRTGAVLGTPAYMAPEQFGGAPCDTRTDQFAYCVTAWQLLTGQRPFRGSTREELRAAASGGAAATASTLPRAVHKVLARGLDPDPARRWPDLGALLEALERVRRRPRRLAMAGVAVVAIAALLAVVLWREDAAPTVCEVPAEVEMSRAWSPATRVQVLERFREARGIEAAVADLDEFAARWIADYRSACTSPGSTRTFAKLGCLLGERDEMLGLTELIPTVPPAAVGGIELAGILPRTQACDGETPVTPPVLPDDPAKRAAIKALRPKLVAAYFAPPGPLLAVMPQLVAQAEQIGWEPLVAEAHHAYGVAANHDPGHAELARDQFKLGHDIAQRSRHYHLEADTATDLVDRELETASDPSDDRAFLDLLAQARAAVRNAGNDPAFVARLDSAEATFARSRGRLDLAIAGYDRARSLELAAHNFGVASAYADHAFDVRLERNLPGDLEAGASTLDQVVRAAAAQHVTDGRLTPLWYSLAFAAERRGDLAAAHELADHLGGPTPPRDAVPISGRVVDETGAPVAGAHVIAWRGTLEGDPTRAYARPRFTGSLATTGADGTFTLRAARDGAVIAELAGRRSQPRPIGDTDLRLVLVPTRTVTGTVACDEPTALGSVFVSAHFALGPAATWRLRAPVTAAQPFSLAGLPPGEATLRLDSILERDRFARKLAFGPPRDAAALRWPTGPQLDVIVRGAYDPDTTLWLLRGTFTPTTRAELERLTSSSSSDVVTHDAMLVGIANQTPAHLKSYQRNDRHALFPRTAPGDITVCATGPAHTSRAQCKPILVRDPPVPVVFDRPSP